MAKYTKPDYSEQWASAGNIVAPNSAKIQAGHIVEKPNYEYMNWLQNRQDTAIAYSLQMGIPEWDNATQYQYTLNSHASYVQRNGVVYKAIQTGTNKDPLTQAAYWTIAFDDKGSAATVQSNINTHVNNYGTLTGLTNTATARTNLDVYSKTEAAQKNGDATKLFSVANGTTGNEAVNKSQLDTKAEKNGNSGETFSVATATSAAHAVRKDQFDAKTGISTDTVAGIVEKATQAEMNAGTANVWPDAATIFNNFASSLGTTGYIRLPAWMGGLTIQWGYNSDLVNTEKVITFPTPFTAACYSVVCTGNAESNLTGAEIITVKTLTTASFTWVGAYADSSGVYPTPQVGWWVAIGV